MRALPAITCRHNRTAWSALVQLNKQDYLFYRHALLLAEAQLQQLDSRRGSGAAGAAAVFHAVDDQPFPEDTLHQHQNLQGSSGGQEAPSPFCTF